MRRAVVGEELRDNDHPARQCCGHFASMAGDSEAQLKDRDDSAHIIRQPFLIGVSGGTASGKVGTLANYFDDFHKQSWLDFEVVGLLATGCSLSAWL